MEEEISEDRPEGYFDELFINVVEIFGTRRGPERSIHLGLEIRVNNSWATLESWKI